MKRTEKSKDNSKQKSKANSRQNSKTNSRQSEPKDYDRDEAKNNEKHITEDRCSQPGKKHPRTDADVWQGQQELKLGEVITTIPKIDFNEETVEYKNWSFTVQKDTEVIHRVVKGRTNEDHLLLKEEPVRN